MNINKQILNDNCFGFCNEASGQFPPARIFHDGNNNQLSEQEESLETEDRQKKRELDALLSKAMSDLTLEERQKQQDILLGIEQSVEDPKMLDQALQELDAKLSLIKQNSMYEVAERINAEYVSARSFRVMFLRANDYDATASADQMLRFFESKYQLFGIEKLVENITIADLNENDLACLRTGYIQLAGRDKAGRQLIAHFAGLYDSPPLDSWLRVQYFMKMRALEDEETQRRGIISIWCAIGGFKSTNGKGWVEGFKAARALPQKKPAVHICLDDIRQYVLSNVMIKLMGGNMRARLRIHCGSPIECHYKLMTYGIDPQSIPFDGSGKMDVQNHLNWIQSCAQEGKSSSSSESGTSAASATSPTRNDVLFTGGKIANHIGNQSFHFVIQNYSRDYDYGNDEAKRQIVSSIIQNIEESGGRFLKQRQTDSGTVWREVPHDELRKKIMQTFRNRRRLADNSKRKADDCTGGTLISGEPLPNDVIFGRTQRNPGTELLHSLIKENFEDYESLGRGVKMRLVETIMQTIKGQSDGGRFLQSAGEPGRWLELSHNTARERISKYFRNYRRPPKAK